MRQDEILSFVREHYIPLGNRIGIQAVYREIEHFFKKEFNFLPAQFNQREKILPLIEFLKKIYRTQSGYSNILKQMIGLTWLMIQNETNSVFPLYYRVNRFISLLIEIISPYFLEPEKLNDKVVFQKCRLSLICFVDKLLSSRQRMEVDFLAFQKRIEQSRYLERDQRLLALISQSDLLKIYDKLPNYLRSISDFKPGDSFIVKKNQSSLPRTITVLRSHTGEFILLLETKHKLANGLKQYVAPLKGANKTGKISWRIDQDASPYFNLQVEINNKHDMTSVIDEVAFSQRHQSRYTNVLELGPYHKKNNGNWQIGVYSPKALGNLRDLIKKEKLTFSQQNQLIHDVLMGVAVLHKRGNVHQDLKPENILIYRDLNGRFRAKLTDYGLSRRQDQAGEEALATQGYQSPEIAWLNSHFSSRYYHYYQATNSVKALGAWHSHQFRFCPPFVSPGPHPSNDMWALGIVFFEIRYRCLPEVGFKNSLERIADDPLLKGLLEVHRSNRFTIEQALQCHKDQSVRPRAGVGPGL